MELEILKVLREQSSIDFDGKILFVNATTKQQMGFIFFNSGSIVGCSYNNKLGKKSLYNLLMEGLLERSSFSFIIEPELISPDNFHFSIDMETLESEVLVFLKKSESLKKLRPPPEIRLVINPDFICKGDDLGPPEFDVLCAISDLGKVEYIYNSLDLYDFEITNSLVSLRKKKAIRVIS